MNVTSFALVQLPNATGAIGVYLVGRKKKVGFLFGAASELAWAAWAWYADAVGIYGWCVAWGFFYLRGYHHWTQGEKTDAVPG